MTDQTDVPALSLVAEGPLSFQQEQLWFMDQLAPGQQTYNLPAALRLHGALDVDALGAALTEVVRRHGTLRTTFVARGDSPVQRVAPPYPVTLEIEPLPASTTPEAAVRLEARQPFDLACGPLFRTRLFRIGPDDHLLTMMTHHICSDGWSTGLMTQELLACYAALTSSTSSTSSAGPGSAGSAGAVPLAALPAQYTDYARWQRDQLRGPLLEAELRYWEETLAGAAVLELPTDRPRPAVPTYQGEAAWYQLPDDLLTGLRTLAAGQRVSLFMALLAAFQVVLARYTGQDDIVVGTASAERSRPEFRSLVGFFTNMLVLRTDVSGNPSFADLLDRVRGVTLDAYEHQEVPFEKLVERIAPHRDPSRNPLFQVAFGLLPPRLAGDQVAGGLRASLLMPDTGVSRFDIAINVQEAPDGLLVWVEYSTDLFDRARMDRMMGHYQQVLRAVVADPSVRLSDVDILTEAERQQVLVEWQGESRPYRRDLVHTMVVEQAARTPDAPAAVFAGQSMCYAELERRSGLLARVLRAAGVGATDVVGVAVSRGVDVPWLLLGVLRAGAAFVPVDLSHPADRVGYVLSDSGARVVLTTTADSLRLPVGGWEALCVDSPEVEARFTAHAGDPLPETATPQSGCYLLYTSGSTGRPKGVLIEHHALATYIDFLANVFHFGPGDRMLQFSSLVFDLAEGEIFTGLSRGATMVFVPPGAMLSPEELSALIRDERVNYVGAPPAMIALLDPEPYPDLRGMLVGGEAFSGELVNRWNLPGRLFLNAYGPTEATIGCTYHPCAHQPWSGSPPIGRAMPHRRVYLVDRWNNPVPVGVPGEILAAGEGLARGYLHRPGLTAEKFVPDPFAPGARAYRTGDLGYWTADGQIQFVGRIDSQVKLRGQRIELEEIEAVLEQHPGVRRAVVALRDDTPSGQGLVGYVIGGVGGADAPPPRELRDHVSARLPGYMVPVAYVAVLGLPLSPTGKVNRSALPAPEPTDFVAADYVAPGTPTEEQVARAFAEVLGAGRIGALDSFFDLGGSSLQAALVLSRIRDHTGVTLPMRHFYSQPTVQAVAAAVGSFAAGAAAGGKGEVIVPLKAGGSRRPLYCVHNVSGSAYTYLPLSQRLPDEQPLFAFGSPVLEGGVPPGSLVELAAEYTAALRAQQPHGPYRLAGHSMGGTIAYQMACALRAAGESVELLVLFDTQLPEPREDGGWPEILQLFVDDLAGVAGRRAPRLDPQRTSEPDPAWLAGLLRDAGVVPPDTGPGFVTDRLPAFAANVRAQWGYRPPAGGFDGRLVLVRAAQSNDTADGWRALCADLDEHIAPGNHYTIFEPANLPALLTILRTYLH